jgi:hypothetical protein
MRALLFSLLLLPAWAHSAVIFSSCPVNSTAGTNAPTVDRFKPDDFRLKLRSYSQEFPLAARYVQWFFSDRKRPASELNSGDEQMRRAGVVWEDVQFVTALASLPATCHSNPNAITAPYAIFPFVLRMREADGSPGFRVRYKLCEYYVDGQRQIPFENECTVIGRDGGYSFSELEQRFLILKEHVETARSSLTGFAYGAGAIASLTSFRFLRLLRFGRLSSGLIGLVPAGVGILAVERKWTDEFARNMIDFKDAAEVAVYGDLSTSVQVAMPIEDFTPYFRRYLESLGE